MALHSFAHSSAPLRRVKTIQFGILPPDEIKGLSVAKIEYPETMEEGTQRPKVGGLSDSRLGTIDRNFKCETCAESMQDCPGHFGHIEVRFPLRRRIAASHAAERSSEGTKLTLLHRLRRYNMTSSLPKVSITSDSSKESSRY